MTSALSFLAPWYPEDAQCGWVATLGSMRGSVCSFIHSGAGEGRAWLVADTQAPDWSLWSVLGAHLAPQDSSSYLPPQSTLGLEIRHHFGGSCVSVFPTPSLPEPCSSLPDVSLFTRQLSGSLPFLPEGQRSNSQTNVTSESGLKVFSQRP